MVDTIEQVRQRIAELGALLFARQLTDTAGGNISARVGDKICITPRYAGSEFQWRLRPEQVLVTDLNANKLEGDGDISRESRAHYRLLNQFSEGSAVVHAHARAVLPFAILRQPIPPVLECTLKFGAILVCDFAPAHSDELAENIARVLVGQEGRIKKQAAAVIAPWHGLFTIGKTLEAAFDATERINLNAQLILQCRELGGSEMLEQSRVDLQASISALEK